MCSRQRRCEGRNFCMSMGWSKTEAFLIQINGISTTKEPGGNPNLRLTTLE